MFILKVICRKQSPHFFNDIADNETISKFAPTPVDLYLSNTTLSGTYEATNSITVENNVTVGGPTVLKAGNTINLKPGFTAPSGIDFTAKIGTVPTTAKRFYYLKDHLGSIRVVVNETGDIVSSDDYDPWGMQLNGRSTDGSYLNAKYKFTGKERDVETGYDYFGARYYDSRIGRWMQVDPLAEKYFGWSPYNYTLNNPLKFYDPDGRFPWLALRAKELITGGLVLTGAVLSAVGLEEQGKAINSAVDWVNNTIPGINVEPITHTPFPITQGEGINQTTIFPSDATSVSRNLETLLDQGFNPVTNLQEQSITVGKTVDAKFEGKKVGVQTHIEIVGGNIHIQIAGSKRKQGIDPTKPIRDQVEGFVKGSKGNVQKIVENIEKGIKKLEELNK